MNIFNLIKQDIIKNLQKIAGEEDAQFDKITVEPTKDQKHGDLATNAAMVCAGVFKKKPRDLAEKLVAELSGLDYIEKIDIAGPGFINIKLKAAKWRQVLASILVLDGQFGFADLGKGEKINLEYASPNPTGPMHIGHVRGAVYGDVLANLLAKMGYEITREFYINDAGNQIGVLLESAYLRYCEALGQEISIPEGLYPGQYLVPIGQKLKEKHQDSLLNLTAEEYLPKIREDVLEAMMDMIRDDLALLNIKHDVFFSEKENLHDSGAILEAVSELENKGLIYAGVLQKPKGREDEVIEEVDQEIQTIFKSTQFGDDLDRVVKKSDGSLTYFAADIAYCKNKFERGHKKMILPLGFDHGGYVKRLEAAASAITDGQASAKVILCQLVQFVENDEVIKMSKRLGKFVTARDIVEEVGADVVRFMMLMRKNDMPFNFDVALAKEQSKDNPVFYVQYAHARGCSILRNANKEIPNIADFLSNLGQISNINFLQNLKSDYELEIVKKIAVYPRIVEIATNSYEPHRIAFYLQELAGVFHSFWNKGLSDASMRFIIADDIELTKARLALVSALLITIKSGLEILGVKALNEL